MAGGIWERAEMSGLAQLFETGLSGLTAATEAMATVSNNTANVSTPGYNVESVNQTEVPGFAGGPGNGTEVTSIQRGFDQFAYQQGVEATSANQAAQVVETNAENLTSLFPVASGGSSGLGAALNSFFSAANTLSQDPSNQADRQELLGQAQSVAADFQSVGSQIGASLGSIDTQTATAVQQINSLTQQIAQLNQAIPAASGTGTAPNSLLDQRDQLVQQLSQQLGVTTVAAADGVVDVYTTGGAELVGGATSYQLATGANQYGDGAVAVTYGPNHQDLTQSLTGGQLGGLLAARSQLVDAQNSLGTLAAGFAAAVNSQQSLGLDLSGNPGQQLFSTAGPVVYASSGNTGTGTVSATLTDPAALTGDNFILTKTAAGFTATDLATGQSTTLGNGPTLSLDGLTITVAGNAHTGDSFEIEPTATAAATLSVVTSDPSAIAAAAAYVATAGSNAGNVTVGAPVSGSALPAGAVQVPASQFAEPLTIEFTSSKNFNVLSSGNTVIASGSLSASSGAEIAIAYPASAAPGEYATVSLSAGTAAAGDSFTLSPGGSGSNGNIEALAALSSQNLVGGQTLGSYYDTLVSTIGSQGQQAQLAVQSTQAILTQAQNTQQSASGVNLDQQAADLVVYQQAYQAAAKVIATAETMFQTLLSAIGTS
jgi:flagellar hook-associated protein 1